MFPRLGLEFADAYRAAMADGDLFGIGRSGENLLFCDRDLNASRAAAIGLSSICRPLALFGTLLL